MSKVKQLIKTATQEDKVRMHPDFQVSIITAHAISGDTPSAMTLLNSLKDSHISPRVFSPLISSVGDTEEGLGWCLHRFGVIKRRSDEDGRCVGEDIHLTDLKSGKVR